MRETPSARTIPDVHTWNIDGGAILFGLPTIAMLEHVFRTTEFDDEVDEDCAADRIGGYFTDSSHEPDDDTDDDALNEDAGEGVSFAHRVWWWQEEGCEGDDCGCGPLSLLAVLEQLPAQERTSAIRVHADEMRSLFDHFWAGQGLVSGASSTIGDACADCLTRGPAHVWDVYGDACELAEEFGEALAAYAYELFVGEPRFDREV